jgi:dienelactone hydrolase
LTHALLVPSCSPHTESQLIEGKVTHEFYRYPNAGHAFCNPSHTDEEEISAALKVKERAKAFFQAKLA